MTTGAHFHTFTKATDALAAATHREVTADRGPYWTRAGRGRHHGERGVAFMISDIIRRVCLIDLTT